jgi:adenosylcobinamide-phosphate guanylyltransferase
MIRDTSIAVIMCGGKGSRMEQFVDSEKPLLKLNGRTMIEYVIDSIVESKIFERVICLSSSNTPKTIAFLYHHNYYVSGKIDVIESKGISYSTDLFKFLNKLKPSKILVVSADIPLLNPKIIQKIVNRCLPNLPCVSIVLEKNFVEDLGVKPSVIFSIKGKEYCHSGILIIDSSKIEDKHTYLEEYYLIMNKKEIAVNINTRNELELAEGLLLRSF